MVCLHLDKLFEELGVSLSQSKNYFVGPCPVHGGNKFNALNLYPEGDSVPGYWCCNTHHCEEVFKRTIIGFTRGVMSHDRYGWYEEGDKTVPFNETISFLCKVIGQDILTLKVDTAEIEKRRFVARAKTFIQATQKPQGIERSLVRSSLDIPCSYFVARGYSKEILTKYDVGTCNNPVKQMYQRAVVPVYDKSGQIMVGCAGRITKESEAEAAKWINSPGFDKSRYLYNYWEALEHIHKVGKAILVEGPGDVWRLEEAGIHNSVAMMGVDLSDEQEVILAGSGAMEVIIMTDNDEAGNAAATRLVKQLRNSYNVRRITPLGKDVGEMTPLALRELFNG